MRLRRRASRGSLVDAKACRGAEEADGLVEEFGHRVTRRERWWSWGGRRRDAGRRPPLGVVLRVICGLKMRISALALVTLASRRWVFMAMAFSSQRCSVFLKPNWSFVWGGFMEEAW